MPRALALLLAALGVFGCAQTPGPPPPGTSLLWGDVRLVPREGVHPGGGGGAYGDRRLRGVEFVDYSRPGYAVVYVPDAEPQVDPLRLTIRATSVRTRFEPENGTVGVGGVIIVENASDEAHVVSAPSLGYLGRLAPGETRELQTAEAGVQGVYLLTRPDVEARVFVAPGRYAVATPTGRYALRGLRPGVHPVRVWHPRFPPTAASARLEDGRALRLDLEVSVESLGGGGDDAE